jgi:hypothetical protein
VFAAKGNSHNNMATACFQPSFGARSYNSAKALVDLLTSYRLGFLAGAFGEGVAEYCR